MTRFAPHMEAALAEARAAFRRAETPVGAVIVDPADGRVVAAAGNRTRELRDPTAHAEMLVIRAACAELGSERLGGLDLYVTLEPCAMCAGALVLARVPRVVYGASDPRAGMVGTLGNILRDPRLNHRAEVTAGVLAGSAAELLRSFFRERRRK